jgi:hypothetical protein
MRTHARFQSASDPEMAPRPTPRHRRQHRSFVPMVVGYGVIRFVSTGDHSQARAKRFDLACTPLPGGGYANMRLRW